MSSPRLVHAVVGDPYSLYCAFGSLDKYSVEWLLNDKQLNIDTDPEIDNDIYTSKASTTYNACYY